MVNYRPYQVRKAQSFAPGVTQRKHVAEFFGQDPIKMNDVVVQSFNNTYGPMFNTIIKKHTAVRTFDDDREFTWKLTGSTYKNVQLKEARKEDGTVIDKNTTGNIGQGGQIFYLVFSEKWFHKGETILGEMNSYYQFAIIEEPVNEGSDVVYMVQLDAGSDTGCPVERLLPGEQFSWEFSLVESEMSHSVGGIREFVPTTMRSEWTTIRKDKKFTGRADRQQRLDVNIPAIRTNPDTGAKEKVILKSWFDNESWIFANEWEREKERALLFARSNRNENGTYYRHGKSGIAIREGDGIIAQMSMGNVHTYNDYNDDFSIEGLVDALQDVCEVGNVPLEERTFVVVTGQRGMRQVNEAIKKQTAGFGITGMHYDGSNMGIVTKENNPVNKHSLGFGGQFVSMYAPNGIVLNFTLDMALDDRERFKMRGPDGKGVMMSYAYYVFDLGTSSQPNIYACKLNDMAGEDTYTYTIGIRNPFGIKSNIVSHDEDSAELHVMATTGACVLDPYRCFMYIPSDLIAA